MSSKITAIFSQLHVQPSSSSLRHATLIQPTPFKPSLVSSLPFRPSFVLPTLSSSRTSARHMKVRWLCRSSQNIYFLLCFFYLFAWFIHVDGENRKSLSSTSKLVMHKIWASYYGNRHYYDIIKFLNQQHFHKQQDP